MLLYVDFHVSPSYCTLMPSNYVSIMKKEFPVVPWQSPFLTASTLPMAHEVTDTFLDTLRLVT